MDVKRGYKQTQVGVIPNDWNVTTVGDLAETSSGSTPPRALADRYFRNGHIPWVKTLDLNNSEIYATEERVTQSAIDETSLRSYPCGCVLVAMYGGFKQIGRTGLLRIPAAVNQAITAIRPDRERLLSEYLLTVLNYRVDYWKLVASSSRKDPNITGTEVRSFPLALPKLKEQEAIAGALSDADALIESLEQLLAKKRDIKQGAMQELLTGKKRLPGFSGEWPTVLITDVAKLESGHTPSRRQPRYWNGEVPWVSLHDSQRLDVMAIYNTSLSISELGLANSSARLLPAGTVVFSRTATIGKSTVLGRPMATSQDFANYVCGPKVHNHFLVALFRSMSRRWRSLMAGSTHNTIYMPVFQKLMIPLPCLKEQIAVVEILHDLDAEIAALETKMSKARQIKQGMMQELLTGRIRLV